MTKQLLIYLQNEHPDKASWISTDETGSIQHAVMAGDFSELHAFALEYEVTLIIPGEDVLLTQVTLPKLNRQRLMQAVPFALEEKLIADIQDLHFVIGDYQTDDTIPVAIIAKHKMDHWLTTLKNIKIIPTRMLPTTLTLPYFSDKVTVCLHDDQCLVRSGQFQGFVCQEKDLHTYLEAHPHQDARHEIRLAPSTILEHMHDWILTQSTFNLLQGTYQSKQKKTFTRKMWAGVGALAIAWVTLAFLNNIVSFIILQNAHHKTELAIHHIYSKHFPEATSMVAPRERMEAKLKKLTHDAQQNDLFNLLSHIGNSLQKTTDISLKNLDFHDNRFHLTVLSNSFASLDDFSQSLTRQGITVKQQSADMVGTQMKASLIINKGVS